MVSKPRLDIIHQEYVYANSLKPVSKHLGVVLHHMGAGSWGNDARNPGAVVHAMHRAQGWAGIGYHGIATQAGLYYTGRKYRHLGSHAGASANHLFGMLWFGGLKDDPTPEALDTIARAVAWLAIDNGFIIGPDTVTGHRDHLSTECPGKLYKHLTMIRTKAMGYALGQPEPEPMQVTGLCNGIEVPVMLDAQGRSWFLGRGLNAQWDKEQSKATITSEGLPGYAHK
jgi:hypothetical protein